MERKGRFADAWLAAKQYDASRYDAASQYSVEFLIVSIDAWLVLERDVLERLRHVVAGGMPSGSDRPTPPDGTCCRFGSWRAIVGGHLDGFECVPLSTRWAFAQPFGRLVATVATYIHRLVFCHFSMRYCREDDFLFRCLVAKVLIIFDDYKIIANFAVI